MTIHIELPTLDFFAGVISLYLFIGFLMAVASVNNNTKVNKTDDKTLKMSFLSILATAIAFQLVWPMWVYAEVAKYKQLRERF